MDYLSTFLCIFALLNFMHMSFLKRAYIWCRRFRYRKGYGVHSPFAFKLITEVIYEKLPYYAYGELKTLRKKAPKGEPYCAERVDKLLFKLVNHFQPEYVLEAGTGAGVEFCYLTAGKADAKCVSLYDGPISGNDDLKMNPRKNGKVIEGELMKALQCELKMMPRIDLLHIAHTGKYRQVYENCFPYLTEKTLVVISGIHDDADKQTWWEELIADKQTGITFDLYEVGLIFFNRAINKQHYIVNF